MPPVPPGGPSTVNGILYQMLYSLLTLGGFQAVRHRLVEGRLDEMTLVLEPSTGGDQQAIYPGKRVVTQLKARSTGGSWSLQEVVRGVLPDLYRAVDQAKPHTEYQFATEGAQGRWAQVEELFQKLSATPPSGDCLAALDDEREIRFGRAHPNGASDTFWGARPYTARRLFRKTVDTLRERAEVAAESYDETCRKTWVLLRGFRFVGRVTHDALRAELDRWLLTRIGSADRLSEKRDHLLLELGRRACSGDAHIDANAFLESSGLAETSLTQWARLSRKTHDHLSGVLRRKCVELSEDVRPGLTDEILAMWTAHTPLLVLNGESGTGKTWHGYRALLTAAESGDVAILVDSRGDADRDLAEAANTFWHRIVGTDETVPLSRLRARLQRIDPANQSRRITLLVDNVSIPEEARRLLEEDWESFGVRLAITCAPPVAEVVRPLLENRGREVQVCDYTLAELQTFLSRGVGIAWEDVPFDVQKTIRRPLLADIFGGLVAEAGWKPRNEYDLYEQAWKSLRGRGVGTFDLDGLRQAALGVLTNGTSYPWTAGVLRDCGLDSEAVDRLMGAGWLRETTSGEFEVWHDRLLNWTIAEALADELAHNSENAESHLKAISGLLQNPRGSSGRMLGYVPLDVMWLLSGKSSTDLFTRLVAACETTLGWRATEILHKELMPTLGSRAVPLLLSRLRKAADSGPSYFVNNAIGGLIATGDEGIRGHAMELLAAPAAKDRRAGVRLITELPTADALDRLWRIHVEGVEKPDPYLWQHSPKWSLYEDTFSALKACVPLNLPWLERTIEETDPAGAPVHDLAYLVSAAGDGGVWRRCKRALFSKVDASHERAIASCIMTFRDRDELEWLESRVAKKEDMVGMVALRALTAIDPRRALKLLDRLDDGTLYFARRWCFSELHLHLPAEVMDHFAVTLRMHDRPLKYALVLQGREDFIDAKSFDFLLDRLAELLVKSLGDGSPPDVSPDCRSGLSFINAVTRPELLDRLRHRRETSLDQNLADWAIALGPQEGEYKAPDKIDALDALARIGGDGFNRVLNVWLERASWCGRMHAVKMAQRRASPRTIELLTELSDTGGTGDDQQRGALSGYAAAALAAHRCWDPVLRHLLRVGLKVLTVVEECCPEIDPPLDDISLMGVLPVFRGDHGATPGSVLCIGIAGRRDLLPEVRAALRRADLGSDLAGACLLALQWLRDIDPDVVPTIARHLELHNHHATNALLANGSSAAFAVLASELRRRPELQLAVILANDPSHRAIGIAAIRRLASDGISFRFASGLTNLVTLANSDLLSLMPDCTEVFALAEEVAYGPYEPSRVTGEKSAALRIVGIKQPEAAIRVALSRLRNPETPDCELYVPVIATFGQGNFVGMLLDIVRLDPPRRVVKSIARELGNRHATGTVLEWLKSPTAEQRLAACQVAGFLPPTEMLVADVRSCAGDADKRVADAAFEACEWLRRSSIVEQLVASVKSEVDSTHRWVLLDALVSVADPEGGSSPIPWQQVVRPALAPALIRNLSERLTEQHKKLNEELNRRDRDR